MSDRTGKSIFAHKQTYSRKGNSKSRSVREIADEAERLDGAENGGAKLVHVSGGMVLLRAA